MRYPLNPVSALLAVVVLSLAGCMTYDPYTDEKKVSNATKGSAIGAGIAAVGAAIANRDDDARTRNERILKAAAVGGAIGGGAGYYMDRQEAKLRAKLRDSGVRVVRDGNYINLIMPSNITFETDKADLRPEFKSVLSSVAEVLDEYDKTLLEVYGHTDSTGSEQYNLRLSQQRAQSVANDLQANGVATSRILTRGYGESQPIASNDTPEGRQQNRRVELLLVPITT
ncbi:MAG: OmpA family protein [Pseudomonadales bacterium]|nr:OmpA family protein [Pseudomonadales bacterium]